MSCNSVHGLYFTIHFFLLLGLFSDAMGKNSDIIYFHTALAGILYKLVKCLKCKNLASYSNMDSVQLGYVIKRLRNSNLYVTVSN